MGLKPYRRKGTGPDAAADFCEQLQRLPIIDGAQITYTTDGTSNIQYIRHGLSRAYRMVFVGGQDQDSLSFRSLSPKYVVAAGKDPTIYCAVKPTAATVTTIVLWVC